MFRTSWSMITRPVILPSVRPFPFGIALRTFDAARVSNGFEIPPLCNHTLICVLSCYRRSLARGLALSALRAREFLARARISRTEAGWLRQLRGRDNSRTD